jgi:tol-pal system protein YbgF
MSSLRRLRLLTIILLVLCLAPRPAHAVNKDILELQTQMQQLQAAIAHLQQSNDESMGALKLLVEQTADSVNKMSITVNGMAMKAQNQQEAFTSKSDQLSGQIQSLNDSLDELKARLDRMQKALTDIQSQQQTTAAVLANLPQGGTVSAPASTEPAAPTPPPAGRKGKGAAALVPDNASPFSTDVAVPAGAAPMASAPPPVADMYRSAYADYIAAKYPLAGSEFSDLIKAYPDDNLAGNAYFYIGEIDSRTQKPTAAVKAYDHVLEHYPDNAKIPAAHLHKAEAMVAMHQNDAATRELRALIQRFPNSPEAAQARTRLANLHAR